MDFRSKNLNNWYWSLALHGTLGFMAVLVFLFNQIPKKMPSIDLAIIETPRLSPKAVEITRPRETSQKKESPQRQVFGVSRKALTGTEGLQVKQGNTVAKAPDNLKLNASDADSLPIPSDEYLVTRMPELTADVRVPYPSEARKKRIQGAVLMDLLINAQGRVVEVKLLEGPSQELSEAALSAVRSFAFKPALIQDKPVAVRIRYAYRFVLEQ